MAVTNPPTSGSEKPEENPPVPVTEPVVEKENAYIVGSAKGSEAEELEIEEDEDGLLKSDTFTNKKTMAQGIMDLALFTSNANQLRYLMMYGTNAPTYLYTLTLIVLSLLLQVAVGIGLVFKKRSDDQGEVKKDHGHHLSKLIVIGIFMITVINVFAAAFSDFGSTKVQSSEYLQQMLVNRLSQVLGNGSLSRNLTSLNETGRALRDL